MIRSTRAITAVVLLVAAGLAFPGMTAGQSCFPQMPPEIRLARGYTFVATYLGRHRPSTVPAWDFAVERVFADKGLDYPSGVALVPGHTSTLDGRCAPMRHLEEGTRYLISKADLATFSSMSTVAWELLPGDRVRLLRQYGSRDMDPRFAKPKTLDEAVALMIPRAREPAADPTLDPLDASRSPVAGLLRLAWDPIVEAIEWLSEQLAAQPSGD